VPTTKPPYPAEFKQQMVELVRTGRPPSELGREFKCSAQSISTWVARDGADKRAPQCANRTRERDVLHSAEREELARLRRENRQLKVVPTRGAISARGLGARASPR